MKKYKIPLIILLVIISIFAALAIYQKIFKEVPESILGKFNSIKSYSCDVEYLIINSRGETKQKASLTSTNSGKDIVLKFEDGRSQIYKNNQIIISNNNTNEKFTVDKDFDKLYKLAFVENIRELFLINGENLKVNYSNGDNLGFLETEYNLFDNNKELNKCKLFINTESKTLTKLIIYDDTDKVRVIVNYTNFVMQKSIK